MLRSLINTETGGEFTPQFWANVFFSRQTRQAPEQVRPDGGPEHRFVNLMKFVFCWFACFFIVCLSLFLFDFIHWLVPGMASSVLQITLHFDLCLYSHLLKYCQYCQYSMRVETNVVPQIDAHGCIWRLSTGVTWTFGRNSGSQTNRWKLNQVNAKDCDNSWIFCVCFDNDI